MVDKDIFRHIDVTQHYTWSGILRDKTMTYLYLRHDISALNLELKTSCSAHEVKLKGMLLR